MKSVILGKKIGLNINMMLFNSEYVLNSCDGSIVSNNNIYMDFGVIKSQCSCTVEHINHVRAIYILSTNPGYFGCGTGIQITKSNNDIQILRCSNNSPGSVLTNLSTTVELKHDYNSSDEYCLRVYTNGNYNFYYEVKYTLM